MEAQNGGGEVRKVHIIYFLSHNRRIEHPHLIRVHHLSRNGVRLRDVKRWLSELRGKDMPESFAWSYKRRYKAGYVWQDLLDEDLITPISDNEYVLKGSQISFVTFSDDLSSYGEKEVSKAKNSSPFEVEIVDPKIPLATKAQENLIDLSTKTSFEIEELPSFGSETSIEETTKQQEDYKFVAATKHEEMQNQRKTEINSFLETFLNKNRNDCKSKKGVNQREPCGSKASPSSNYSFRKSSSYSDSGASHMFLNLITCGIVDTNESAVTVMNRWKKGTSMMNSSSKKENGKGKNIGQIDKGDKVGGSERFPRDHWTTFVQQRESRIEGSKTSYNMGDSNYKANIFPAAYTFGNGPYCSQCGRQFNPEKLYTHMKSCRGMKALAKAAKSKS